MKVAVAAAELTKAAIWIKTIPDFREMAIVRMAELYTGVSPYFGHLSP
jgi:hypothetical protein